MVEDALVSNSRHSAAYDFGIRNETREAVRAIRFRAEGFTGALSMAQTLNARNPGTHARAGLNRPTSRLIEPGTALGLAAQGHSMEIRRFDIDGPLEIIPRRSRTSGVISRRYSGWTDCTAWAPQSSLFRTTSRSAFARAPFAGSISRANRSLKGKLVRCLAGRLFDVAVDLRARFADLREMDLGRAVARDEQSVLGSGRLRPCLLHAGAEFGDQLPRDELLQPGHDKGVAWDDPDIGIDWPDVADPRTLSGKGSRATVARRASAYFR